MVRQQRTLVFSMRAGDIPAAHTPIGGFRQHFPEPVLANPTSRAPFLFENNVENKRSVIKGFHRTLAVTQIDPSIQ
jgi:hypothetical protein